MTTSSQAAWIQVRSAESQVSLASALCRVVCVLIVVIILLLSIAFHPETANQILLLFGFVSLAFANYYCCGQDVLHPAFIFTAIWAIVIAVYCFCPIDIDPIGLKTTAIFLTGGICFSVGVLLGNRPFVRRAPKVNKEPNHVPSDNFQARLLLLTYVIFTVPLFLNDTARIAGGISFSPLFFVNLRIAMLASFMDGANPYSSKLVSTAPMIAVLTLWILIMEEKRKWAIVLCSTCVVVLTLLETSRTTLMQMLCGSLCLLMLRMKDRGFRKMMGYLSAAALGVVLLMTAISLLTKLETQGSDRIQTSAILTARYIAGPLAGFNYAVYHPEAFRYQPATIFAEALAPLSRLSIIRYTPPPAVDKVVYIPFAMNVYTCFKPYYEDFGAVGCITAFVLFGLVEGRLFYAAVRGDQVSSFFLAYLSYAVMFSTFDDSFHLLVRYLYVLAYALTYFGILKRLRITW